MEYGKIIAVTGLPGLFELLSSKNDGAIVRSLEDKTTRFVSARVHNLSHLESIEVFTVRDNVNLASIFQAMEKDAGGLPDAKDGAALKKYFEKVFPELDFQRVYSSDLKKMAKWFDILKQNNVEIKLSEPAEEEDETEAETGAPATIGAGDMAAKDASGKAAGDKKQTRAVKDEADADKSPKKKATEQPAGPDEEPAEKKKKTAAKKKDEPASSKKSVKEENEPKKAAKKSAPKKPGK